MIDALRADVPPSTIMHKGGTVLRAIDVHVHPMNAAYVEASLPFMAAAQRMFKGKFEARPDQRIAEDSGAMTPW